MTADNFLLELVKATASAADTWNEFTPTKTYDQSTGILTYTLTPKYSNQANWHTEVRVYCVS